MTPAELNALNRLVSEKVMGWQEVPKPFTILVGQFWNHPQDGPMIKPDKHSHLIARFNPAESPADALAVLKVIAQKLGHLPEIRPSRIGWAWIVRHEAGNASTLETAICQFSVKLFQ